LPACWETKNGGAIRQILIRFAAATATAIRKKKTSTLSRLIHVIAAVTRAGLASTAVVSQRQKVAAPRDDYELRRVSQRSSKLKPRMAAATVHARILVKREFANAPILARLFVNWTSGITANGS